MSAASSEAPAAGPVRRKIPFLPNIFYGWWILIAGTSIMTVVGTTNTYGLSLFFIPLITQFGWSRRPSPAPSPWPRLESGLIGPLEGLLVDRFGPRKMMLLGVPLNCSRLLSAVSPGRHHRPHRLGRPDSLLYHLCPRHHPGQTRWVPAWPPTRLLPTGSSAVEERLWASSPRA